MVVANSTCARNGAFIENIGTYNPVVKPTHIEVNDERALHWLLQGAKPTETTAYLLNKVGVLERFFEQRPGARKNYAFLDKTTSMTLKKSAVDASFEATKTRKEAEPEAEAAKAEEIPETIAVPEALAADEPESESAGSEEMPAETAEEPEPEEVASDEPAPGGPAETTKEGE
jgi:small subunit ribosomal protein S16